MQKTRLRVLVPGLLILITGCAALEAPSLVKDLGSSDIYAQVQAKEKLASFGDSAIGALAQAMKSNNKTQRLNAVDVLERIKSEKSADVLAQAILKEKDKSVRDRVVLALVALKDKALKPLVSIAPETNKEQGMDVATALLMIGEKKVVPMLIAVLQKQQSTKGQVAVARILRALTGNFENVTEKASPTQRRYGIARWKEWWERNAGSFKLPSR